MVKMIHYSPRPGLVNGLKHAHENRLEKQEKKQVETTQNVQRAQPRDGKRGLFHGRKEWYWIRGDI